MSETILRKYAKFGGLFIQLRANPTGKYHVGIFDGDQCIATSGGEDAMEESCAKDRSMELVREYRKLEPGPEPGYWIEWKLLTADKLRKHS